MPGIKPIFLVSKFSQKIDSTRLAVLDLCVKDRHALVVGSDAAGDGDIEHSTERLDIRFWDHIRLCIESFGVLQSRTSLWQSISASHRGSAKTDHTYKSRQAWRYNVQHPRLALH